MTTRSHDAVLEPAAAKSKKSDMNKRASSEVALNGIFSCLLSDSHLLPAAPPAFGIESDNVSLDTTLSTTRSLANFDKQQQAITKQVDACYRV
jgi:hypothetical protein